MSTTQAVAVAPTARHSFQQSLGVGRRSAKGFAHPVSVTLDSRGQVYVLNRSSSWKDQFPRVTVIPLDEEDFREIGEFGTEPGCLFMPTAAVIDAADHLYIADEHLHTVTVFDCDGTFVTRWGEPGSALGQLNRPSGLAVDSAGNLWVVDHGNSRVQCFTPEGHPLLCFGSAGSGPGEFNLPWGIAVGPDDDVWVADWRNDRVQRFDPAGRHRGSYGEHLLTRPAAVAVAKDGTTYVADWGNDCVRVLDETGRLQETWEGDATLSKWAQEYLGMYDSSRQLRQLAQAAGRDSEERRFWQPSGITLSAGGLVFVADTGRHRVQVYRRDDDPAPRASAHSEVDEASEEESAVTRTATAGGWSIPGREPSTCGICPPRRISCSSCSGTSSGPGGRCCGSARRSPARRGRSAPRTHRSTCGCATEPPPWTSAPGTSTSASGPTPLTRPWPISAAP